MSIASTAQGGRAGQRRGRSALRSALIVTLFGVARLQAMVVEKNVAQLAVEADRIVVGDVIGVVSDWTPAGHMIDSVVAFSVTDNLKGSGPVSLHLQMPGGTVGDLSAFSGEHPTLVAGDHALLFLAGPENRLVGAYQGAFLTDGVLVVQTEGGPPGIAESTMRPLASLIEEIQAALPEVVVPQTVTSYEGEFTLPDPLRFATLQCNWTHIPQPMGEPYRINTNCAGPHCGNGSQQIAAIRFGESVWNAIGTNFEFTYGGTSTTAQAGFDGQNVVLFDHSGQMSSDIVAGTVFWCFQSQRLVEWDIRLNNFHFSFWAGHTASCPAGTFDLKAVATHEFGHGLGLGHSLIADATMYGGTTSCNLDPRDLHADDLAGAFSIYGECGNGLIEGPEQCDDGGTLPGDGCGADCRFEPLTGNNSCANAIVLTEGAYNFTTVGATTDGPNEGSTCNPGDDGQLYKDVWFRYHAPCTGQASIRLCGTSFDTMLAVYEGAGCPAGPSALHCDHDSSFCGPASLQSALFFTMMEGQDYLIRVGGYAGESGQGVLTIDAPICPSNDECVNTVPVGDGETFFDTTGATTDGPSEPGICTFFNNSQVSQDVWYCYTASCTGLVTVDLCNALYDTKVAVYEGCGCPAGASAIACNDDGCGLQSVLAFPGVAGNSYLVRIGGFREEEGPGSVFIACTGSECDEASDCDDGDPCTENRCVTGNCRFDPKNSGPCSDGDPCTAGDSCSEGVCVAGEPLECDDRVFCNGQEVCLDGACMSLGEPCADGAWCDEASQACIWNGSPGDSDFDGDVDLYDITHLQRCFGAYTNPKCQTFDLGGQGGVVELADWLDLIPHFEGPGS